MVKKYKFLLILLLVNFNSFLYSQTVMFWPQGDVPESISGRGFIGTTESSITNVTAGNPAAISVRQGFNIGISYQHDTKIKNAILDKADLYRANYYPQAAGITFDYRNFTFGLGFDQSYNLTRDYGKIIAAIVADNEQGYIETDPFNARTEETLFKNSIIITRRINQLFGDNSHLEAGFSFNHCRYHYASIAEPEIIENLDVTIAENNFSLGLNYQYTGKIINTMKLGFYYESAMEFYKTKNLNISQNRFRGYVPPKLHAGFSFGFSETLDFRSNFSYLLWESADNNFYDIENQPELSFTFSKQFTTDFSSSFGFFSSNRRFFKEESYLDLNRNFLVRYLLIGCIYHHDDFILDLSVADSHLLSDENRKHTIFKIGLGYHWNRN